MIQLNTWLHQGNKHDVEAEHLDRSIRKIVRLSLPTQREHPFAVEESPLIPEAQWTFEYLWSPFDDDGKLLTAEKLKTIELFVMTNLVPTLVHCSAGQNRSVVISTYLLTLHDGLSPEDASRFMKERHGNVKVYPTLVDKMKKITGMSFEGLL